MIFSKFSVVAKAIALALALLVTHQAQAGPGHDDKKAGRDDHGDAKMAAMGGHAHGAWSQPPQAYAGMAYEGWNDPAAAKRGKAIFNQQCAACHGQKGTVNGPLAASLEHPPADLTTHFHQAPGEGDGYLFWRISEGGQVEPFKSANSAMPAFEGTLSESQRWDVLSYVHQAFHGGFKRAAHGGAMGDIEPHGEAMGGMAEQKGHGHGDKLSTH